MQLKVFYTTLNDVERTILHKMIKMTLPRTEVNFIKLTDDYAENLNEDCYVMFVAPPNENSVFYKRVQQIGLEPDITIIKKEHWLQDKKARQEIFGELLNFKERVSSQHGTNVRTILKKEFPSISDAVIEKYLKMDKKFVVAAGNKHWYIVPDGTPIKDKNTLTVSELLILYFLKKIWNFNEIKIINNSELKHGQ